MALCCGLYLEQAADNQKLCACQMPVSELAPAIQQELAFWAAVHIQEASSTDELQQIQGSVLSQSQIFKAILHSLYPYIINDQQHWKYW